ncbi:MAG: universal stress protein [Balneola sp.]
MKVNRILIPTDFSENSNTAISAVDTFVNLFDCKVDLIHIVPLSTYLGESISSMGLPLDMGGDIYPKIVQNAKQKLKEFSIKYFKEGTVGELIVDIDRKPSNAIVEHAEKGKYDMIIMSAKGGHSSNFLHGSITEKVVRNSKIPVLALDNQLHHDKINTVMVPTDMSDFSLEVIPMAFEMASKFNATMTLFSVLELYNSGVRMSPEEGTEGLDYVNPINKEGLYSGLMNRLENFFQNYDEGQFSLKRHDELYSGMIVKKQRSESISVPLRTEIKKGFNAYRDIIEYANEHADLVIMNTHGRTGLSRLLLGSTTEQITQHLTAPLLTVHKSKKS